MSSSFPSVDSRSLWMSGLFEASNSWSHSKGVQERNRSSNWAAVFRSLTKGAWSDQWTQSYAWAIFNSHACMHKYVFYGLVNVTDTPLEDCDILKWSKCGSCMKHHDTKEFSFWAWCGNIFLIFWSCPRKKIRKFYRMLLDERECTFFLQDQTWAMNRSFQWTSVLGSRRQRYAQENWRRVMKLESKKSSNAHEICIISDVGCDTM